MFYAFVVALLSVAGAALPLRTRPAHATLQVYLSVAAGALLGAAMFHLLPESAEHVGSGFSGWAVGGILIVFFLQRYVAPHSHEAEPAPATAEAPSSGETRGHGHEAHGHDQRHAPRAPTHGEAPAHGHAHGASAVERPFLGRYAALLALSVHSFFDGVAIGAASGDVDAHGHSLSLAVFVSVTIHKPMDGLSVSILLLNAGTERRKLWIIQVLYAALVPLGAAAFLLTRGAIAQPSAFIGYILAFSGGTFLAIALTDLLPELHFHTHDRNKLSAALLSGIIVMWLTARIGHANHAHEHQLDAHSADHPTPVTLEQPHEPGH